MEFARQIRGARAVLNWTREDLAERSGLSVPGIGNIESGASPTGRTQRRIERAFANAGVSFTRNGIEYSDSPIVILSDDDPEACYLLLLDDVARVLVTEPKPELLIAYADDRASPPSVNEMYRKLRADGVAMRQLVEAGNSHLMGALDEYRCIPSTFFINRVTVIYGANVATVTAGESRITIFRDPVNAARERNTFNLLWSKLDPPTESTADERF
jgi:transcriptional regulator with XRE-family HTH domain